MDFEDLSEAEKEAIRKHFEEIHNEEIQKNLRRDQKNLRRENKSSFHRIYGWPEDDDIPQIARKYPYISFILLMLFVWVVFPFFFGKFVHRNDPPSILDSLDSTLENVKPLDNYP